MLRAIRALREGRVFLLMLVVMSASAAHGQTTAFTYQGQLSDAGALANGSYDLRFALFDSTAGGAQIGANQTVPAVPVGAGVFTVQLDFGVNAFPGANRFVRPRRLAGCTSSATRALPRSTARARTEACGAIARERVAVSTATASAARAYTVRAPPAPVLRA